MANKSMYNEQVDCANCYKREAIASIEQRLKAWANGDYVESNAVLGFWKCISNFNRYYKIKPQKELHIRSWECGVCQMVDITNASVCKVLPYLITSYIYNFHRNEFVKGYCKEIGGNIVSSDSLHEKEHIYYSGASCKHDFIGAINEKDKKHPMQDLLRGKKLEIQNPNNVDYERIPLLFDFGEDLVYQRYGDEYILPEDKASDFADKVKEASSHWQSADGLPQAPQVAAVEEYVLYRADTIFEIFSCLYHIIDYQATSENSHFMAAPDPLLCLILLANALQDEITTQLARSVEEVLDETNICKIKSELAYFFSFGYSHLEDHRLSLENPEIKKWEDIINVPKDERDWVASPIQW